MKTARLAVLGVALAAGGGAAYLMMSTRPPEPVSIRIPPPPPKPVEAVLVAARDLSSGNVVSGGDVRWKPWPNGEVSAGSITQSRQPSALSDVQGKIVDRTFSTDQPIQSDQLKEPNYMSAKLPSGMRAVAIDLADQGKTAAGGFILPNDRVDVIRTFHPDEAPMSFASETILTNIRVLAIGQIVQEKSSDRTVIGGTATLEMTGEQAEKVILAQRTGQLTLSLRSTSDVASDDAVKPQAAPVTMTIIRSGNASQSRVK